MCSLFSFSILATFISIPSYSIHYDLINYLFSFFARPIEETVPVLSEAELALMTERERRTYFRNLEKKKKRKRCEGEEGEGEGDEGDEGEDDDESEEVSEGESSEHMKREAKELDTVKSDAKREEANYVGNKGEGEEKEEGAEGEEGEGEEEGEEEGEVFDEEEE